MLSDADQLRRRIDAGASEADLGPRQLGPTGERASRALLPIEWPSGLEPTPAPLAVEPARGVVRPSCGELARSQA